MKVGAEPKKVAIAAGLIVVAAYLMYTNVIAGDTYGTSSRPQAAATAAPPLNPLPAAQTARTRPAPAARPSRVDASIREWTVRIGAARPEDRADPNTTDLTLRLDVLARLQNATTRGGHRSLFDFSAAPVAVPDTKILPKKPTETAEAKPPAEAPKPETEAEKPKPPPPAIPLKFYGYVSGRDGRRAFFLQGEDIFTASEGQLVQSRYKIVRIGTTSAEVEDTKFDNKQTLPIEPEPRVGG
jgi:hypothetical protein